MLKRTFFVAKNDSHNPASANIEPVVPDSALKLLKSEFYLKAVESSQCLSSADETTSLSSASTE